MRPLDDVTVVALEQAVAAPFATRQLADQGARVIKIERVDGGDLARGYDEVVDGVAAHFVWLNRGKESLAIDLKSPEGQQVVRNLVRRADVFVQNLAPGAAARLGLDAASLRRDQPELVAVDVSGYGARGPMTHRKAYDLLIQADSGLVSLTGTSEMPVKAGIPAADIATGMYAAQGILTALLRRGRTGEGSTLEVSMLEATVEWLGHAVYTQLYTGDPPPRLGLSHNAIAPYGRFPTRDGEILIGVQSEAGWRALVRDALGRPGLVDDPRFATNVDRVRNRAACDATVASLTSSWVTADLDAALAAAGVPAGQIRNMESVVDHEQLRARDRWRTVGTEMGPVPALLPPVTVADSEASMGDVPALGEHSMALLLEAGLDREQAELLLERQIAARPHPVAAAL